MLVKPILKPDPSPPALPVGFDPEKHLAYQPPPKVLKMADIGYPKDTGISPFATCEAFPLFTQEAIRIMRAEVFTEEVWDNCLYLAANASGCHIRGHCPKYAKFMHDALTHPRTLKIISEIAGIDLVPVMDSEVGSILVASSPESVVQHRLANGKGDSAPGQVTNWHYDHYSFVCVVMLSDTTGMVGGETAIQLGNGSVQRVRGPDVGSATVLQGRFINHQALAAQGGRERISMVTSYRPRDPMVNDDVSLKYITRITDIPELYYQFGDYRLEILEGRIRQMRKAFRGRHDAGKSLDISALKGFLEQQIKHLEVTNEEILTLDKLKTGKQYGGGEIFRSIIKS
ncbi:hypothetical protein K469DRAFT_592545 [Zopfia rhizophila CBS 207.26]|uniref:Fe2OG dioxygenase domain-containing protein n=1 Tax=Zopfia rhizophila CBS 207.26 TaxID=1314779 RepID=A0A6A6DRT4_9PEZI|nr:hypothetical protein K469DRAFT_592545 [Zopfia rhizophila CBS 207.26]